MSCTGVGDYSTGQANFVTSLGDTFHCRFGGVRLLPLWWWRRWQRGQLECDALSAEAAHAEQDATQHGEQEEGRGLIGSEVGLYRVFHPSFLSKLVLNWVGSGYPQKHLWPPKLPWISLLKRRSVRMAAEATKDIFYPLLAISFCIFY